jgi:uracil-DNA glycosylase
MADLRTLLCTYLRQQKQLSTPDFVLTKNIVLPVLCEYQQKNDVQRVRESTKKKASAKATSSPPGSSPAPVGTVPAQSDHLSKLSRLEPLEKLHANFTASNSRSAQPEKSVHDGLQEKRTALRELYYRTKGCTKCGHAQTRSHFVFGAGNANASLLVIGEAPGAEEDKQGLPFVGKAGKLLTDMLAAIKVDRKDDVFITNVLKCRPPENRTPESSEIISCLPLLKEQIEIIRPKAILLLGRIAAHALLECSDLLSAMRTRVHQYQHIPAIVTYHPAALLRNSQYKRPAWEDLQKLQKILKKLGCYNDSE